VENNKRVNSCKEVREGRVYKILRWETGVEIALSEVDGEDADDD
jgi:hypothetical protein